MTKFPKAPVGKRILSSLTELLFLDVFSLLGFFAGVITAGLANIVINSLVLWFYGFRDLSGSAFSLGKKVAQLRVVDVKSGEVASDLQAVKRNIYYILPICLQFFVITTPLAQAFMKIMIFLDLVMILSSPQGRRLGDFIAGTQVVVIEER